MISLVAALLALIIGPWIVIRAEEKPRLRDALDGFIFIAIGGLVLLDILPHLLESLGWMALLLVAVGYWGPSWLEHRFRAAAHSTHLLVVAVAALGLVIHTLADGAVLSDGEQASLGLAIWLHRIPVAMTVWWLLRPAWGRTGPTLVLTGMGAGTLIGYGLGVQWASPGPLLSGLEAIVAGSILHVVFNRLHLNPKLEPGPEDPRAEGLGNLAGLLFLLVVFAPGLDIPPLMADALERLWSLTLVAAPAVLLGYTLAGLLAGLVPVSSMAWIARGGPSRQSLNGMLVGLPMPVCSCGVVPLYRSLMQRGVPPAAGMSFLIATPELGLDALIVSLPLLGFDMTLARLVAAAVIAWLIGRWIGARLKLREPASSNCCHSHMPEMQGSLRSRAWQGIRYGYTDLLDATAPWLVLGLLIAAFSAPLLELVPQWGLPGVIEVAAFALLGLPVYVCATGSTPIVAVMLLGGVSPGAALAFLITGPATNPATFGLLAQLHGRGAALAFGSATAALAVLAGLLLNQIPGLDIQPMAMDHAGGALWQQLSLLVLAVLLLGAVLRRGARALMGELQFRAQG